ncbi:MAG: TetR/AcrR family transcriptional regulator [Vicinamibacterales bacterium]
MASTRTGTPRLGTPTLTASDWADAALQLIAEAGLRAVTVRALAARLGVTKGSFYWHFQGREELLAAALARWERRATAEAVQALDAIRDYRRRLALIFDAASQPPRARSLYASLAAAADEPVVKAVLARVGAARIDYLDACYRKLGLPQVEARARAVFAYAAYRGLLQLAHESPASLPIHWSPYADLMRQVLLPAVKPTASKAQPARRRRRSGESRR